MKTSRTNRRPLRAAKPYDHAKDYAVWQANCNDLLAKIAEGLAKHAADANAEGIHGGHCGDLQDLNYRLQQISDSLHHEGEYAN